MLIKVFEINANWRENYSPIKEINAKEGLNFKMREINAINTKKHFVPQLEQINFPTELKNHEQNRSTGVWGNFFTDNAREILRKCRKAIVLWVSRMSRLEPEFGIKMMEIKVAQINAPLNKQRGN